MSADEIRGYLIVNVEEGSGTTQDGKQFTWESPAGASFEAFVKVEIRGGSRSVKTQTRKAALVGHNINWGEELRLEILEGSTELRLMMCKEKWLGTKRGTSVIAACGIFMSDILEAVPIDKYFELFKPNNGGEGGLIRVSMNFVKSLDELDVQASVKTTSPMLEVGKDRDVAGLVGIVSDGTEADVAQRIANMEREASDKQKPKRGRGLGVGLLLAALAAGGVVVALKKRQ